jgi:hypothetical protein
MSEAKSRKMLLSITTLLSHKVSRQQGLAKLQHQVIDKFRVNHRVLLDQDGSILDAITMWKENLDKQFEGVEPCIICYSVRL